jgi:hydrogenase maturation protease
MIAPRESVLIVGLGNMLLSDEGLGVHVARALTDQRARLRAGVEVLEAGTCLLDVLPAMAACARAILVDAISAGGEPGTVYRAELAGALDGPEEGGATVSLHQWGVLQTLRAGEMLGLIPPRITLLGAEPERLEPGTELSPALARARDRIVSLLLDELAARDLLEDSGHGSLPERARIP